MDSQTPGLSSSEVRNWLELPLDVLSLIFLKLGVIDILFRAQSVCSVWRNFSKEPLLFRSIDMRNGWNSFDHQDYDIEKILREALDRSSGQLVAFSMADFCNDESLAYIADRSGELRCLRLVTCYEVNCDALINLAKTSVMLEELEICHCSFTGDKIDMLKTIGSVCPQIKLFRLNCPFFKCSDIECDDEALAIAESMPELRHLHLFGNQVTNVGLREILDGCPHVESLDLRQCFNLNLKGDLLKICRDRLIKLRLPNDSTDDYEFPGAARDGSDVFSEGSYLSDSDDDSGFDYHPNFDFDRGNGFDSDSDFGYGNELPYDPEYYD
ncbi:hypothetical protein MKW98_001590 [Papaver atlanticum]|uniref:F-box domain-containing protein n=1 Tax=Papaver atlanticum TaxID=357466 RepID=A0AAD4S8V7_9MAGN|nr:hypothetical protein MKW98_001590 [Papaver atlanticum]